MTIGSERAAHVEQPKNQDYSTFSHELNGSALESVPALQEWMIRFNATYCNTERSTSLPHSSELEGFLREAADPGTYPKIVMYLSNGERAVIGRKFSGDKLLHVDVVINDGGATSPKTVF